MLKVKDSHKILLQGQLFGYTGSDGRVSQVALVVKNQLANEGDIRDASLSPGSGRFPRGGHGNPFWYFRWENPMDSGVWWARVHGVRKGQTGQK